MHTLTHTYMYTYMYTYIHTYIHTQIHTHTHTHTHTLYEIPTSLHARCVYKHDIHPLTHPHACEQVLYVMITGRIPFEQVPSSMVPKLCHEEHLRPPLKDLHDASLVQLLGVLTFAARVCARACPVFTCTSMHTRMHTRMHISTRGEKDTRKFARAHTDKGWKANRQDRPTARQMGEGCSTICAAQPDPRQPRRSKTAEDRTVRAGSLAATVWPRIWSPLRWTHRMHQGGSPLPSPDIQHPDTEREGVANNTGKRHPGRSSTF